MITETLKEKFNYDTPIFTKEILSLFPQYSKAYIFRLLKLAEEEGRLTRVDSGVYYLPQETPFGPSSITASDIARKRYIQSGDKIYGLYSGITLQNEFFVTTQFTNTPEIITNRESSRRRKVTIDGMTFILRKSRTKIDNENVDAYRILQLFSETNGLEINGRARSAVNNYIRSKKISRESLLELARFFPDKTLNYMIYNEVI